MNKTPSQVTPAKPEEYDEERVPFADVMRKLANTKPPHKTVKPVQPKPATAPKKG